MAKKNTQDTSGTVTNTFIKGLNKDADSLFVQEGMWTHARNAVNNTSEGDLGTLSNAESNILCTKVAQSMILPINPLTGGKNIYITGTIYLFSSYWVIYSVGYDGQDIKPIMSEIGLFDEERCSYRPIVQASCLNFNKLHLITGASKLKDDCTWQVYWADGLNPDRYMNIGDPKLWPSYDYTWLGGGPSTINYYTNGVGPNILWPGVAWLQNCTTSLPTNPTDPACVICKDDNELVCDDIRLATLVDTPCLTLSLSQQPGVIENGSYTVMAAYVINRQRVTNYFSNTYIQPIYNTPNERGSLEIQVDADSVHFDEFELVVVRFINQNLSAKRIGYYSTRVKTITLDQIPETKETVPVESLLLQNPVFEVSNQISEVNNYLLRVGPISKFDFNYQPLANLIRAEWMSVEYPETYYVDGGNHTSYLRDEVYSFFIRWVYNTGDKSASYHIPGRPPQDYYINGANVNDIDLYVDNNISINTLPGDTYLFESVNTATVIPLTGPTQYTADGGQVIAKGQMGYWQSTELYSDNQPEIWNSSSHCWTMSNNPDYDLCGKEIRHHKFPDNAIHPNAYHFNKVNGKYTIRLMGVSFNNIIYPKDNDGVDIPGIVGYEILRGSRHGSKSILAKGMINNFRDYNIQGSAANSGVVGLYANYPFNCITPALNQNTNPTGALSYNYQFNDPFIVKKDSNNNKQNQNIPTDIISFHSPDTSFINPYLSTSEVKIYGSLQGTAEQRFIEPSKHPEFKLLSNKVFIFALFGGLINAILKGLGQIDINYPAGNFQPSYGLQWTNVTPGAGNTTVGLNMTAANELLLTNPLTGPIPLFNAALNTYFNTAGPLAEAFTPGTIGLKSIFNTANNAIGAIGNYYTMPAYNKKYTGWEMLPPAFQGLGTAVTAGGQLFFYFLEGMNETIDTLYAVLRKKQYALEQIGHGDYSSFVPPNKNYDRRFIMENGQYINDQSQSLPEFIDFAGNLVKYRINNIKRPKLAVIRTTRGNGLNFGPHFITTGNNQTDDSVDQSLMTLGYAVDTFNSGIVGSIFNTTIGWSDAKKQTNFINNIASHYVGLKYKISNQYGQLDSIQQVVATNCEQKFTKANLPYTNFGNMCGVNDFTQSFISTDLIFGGDTYINRFTEKTIMPFFYDWLYDVPDNIEYNYYINQMIPEPKFMVNSQPWDISGFNLENIYTWITNNPDYGSGILPGSYYDLDSAIYVREANNNIGVYSGIIGISNAYFYTAACGIKDFFVESEVLVDFRNTGTFPWEQPYSKYNYTDLPSLFDSNPQVLAKGNYYAYDYTLSASRFLFNQYFTAGYLQGKTYDPNVAELCYTSYPNRINYSLQQQEQSLTDAWLMYLPLNKVDFKSEVSSVKTFAKTGMFITFKNDSPLIYQGVDTLKLDASGTKVTVGDAGLFNQAAQNVVIADKSYEYGSCQNKYSVISTPAGLYYMSSDQGKIFAYREGLEEISQDGMKWWFSYFLPFKLLDAFPDYPHTDNPVAGIGCNATYDNWNSILYFSKRDFKLRETYIDQVTRASLVTYDETSDKFIIDADITKFKYPLGHPTLFEDASWTTGYDPKTKYWVSFYDWVPNLIMPSVSTFYTTKGDSIWKQAGNCAEYCNFYGVQYPFEVEIPIITPQQVNTLRSVEYYLESYKGNNQNCVDQFHMLDYNFDKAVIYNSEQVSGELNLNLFPKNNITLSLTYPALVGVSPNQSYDILYSKEEQKYRFNQFWDITKDRGEFPIGSSYPPVGPVVPGTTTLLGNYAEKYMWLTEANGYIKSLNQDNLDYTKSVLQRKKFRHYVNFLRLVKTDSNKVNMILKIINTKNQISLR